MNYIFDFDGTIVDSLPAMIAVYNKIIRNEDNPLTAEEIDRLRGMSSRRALRNLGVRWWQIPKLLLMGMGDFHAMIPNMKPCKGVPAVIKELHRRGDSLYIVTSNTHENVVNFLEAHELTDYFIDMKTGAGLFRKGKHLRRLISDHKLKRRETIYIGDETRDIRAARTAFIKIASVTWGFNTYAILKRQRPSYIVDKPKDLLLLTTRNKKA